MRSVKHFRVKEPTYQVAHEIYILLEAPRRIPSSITTSRNLKFLKVQARSESLDGSPTQPGI